MQRALLPDKAYALVLRVHLGLNAEGDDAARRRVPDGEIAHDGLVGIVHDLAQDLAVLRVIGPVHGLAGENPAHRVQNAPVFQVRQGLAVGLRTGLFLAGLKQEDFPAPFISRGEQAVFLADRGRIGVAAAVELVEDRIDAADQNITGRLQDRWDNNRVHDVIAHRIQITRQKHFSQFVKM